jgi:hypothetical protein
VRMLCVCVCVCVVYDLYMILCAHAFIHIHTLRSGRCLKKVFVMDMTKDEGGLRHVREQRCEPC